MSGDVIIGFTWDLVAKLKALPWFDRVASSSNIADGISRKLFAGPWKMCPIVFPPKLMSLLASELRLG